MIDKKKLERRFSRNARTYDAYASVQKTMSHKLMDLVKVRQVTNILEIGCGTGYLTSLLIQTFPEAKVTALDLASGMIDVAKERMIDEGKEKHVEFICADIETDFPNQVYDLIISNATFQWFNHPSDMAQEILTHLKPEGQCLFSTFGNNTFKELAESFQVARAHMDLEEHVKASQDFLSAYEWVMCLENAKQTSGIRAAVTSYETMIPEYFENCMAFFKSIKKIGANRASGSRPATSPKFMQKVTDIYESEFRTPKGIPATYHALYLSVEVLA